MNIILLVQFLSAVQAGGPAHQPAGRAAAATAACTGGATQAYHRKAQLPHGALAALGFPMADAGAPYNATDVVMDSSRKLPFARFISARRCGSILQVEYERGGIGYSRSTALLKRNGSGWILVRK